MQAGGQRWLRTPAFVDAALLASRSTGTDTSLELKAATSGRYIAVVSAASALSLNGEDYRLTASAALEDAIPESAIKGTSAGE